MTQAQIAKIVTGIVVAVTQFFVILFAVLVYQWVTIGVNQSRINRAEAEAAALAEKEQAYKEDLEDIMYDPITKNDLLIKYENQN